MPIPAAAQGARDHRVGQSGFRCDLAIRRPGARAYHAGIFVDTEAFYRTNDILERDLLRPRLLRDFGWNVATVLTKDWLENAEAVLDRLAGSVPKPEQE
jgi:hypothetical protein